MCLSRQLTALVLTTKNNETKQYIHPKHKGKNTRASKPIYTLIWYTFTAYSQETDQAVFLQPWSPHTGLLL